MAARKGTPETAVRKAPVKAPAERRITTEAMANNNGVASRLLREAAWSRMFGRIESKNPFAR